MAKTMLLTTVFWLVCWMFSGLLHVVDNTKYEANLVIIPHVLSAEL